MNRREAEWICCIPCTSSWQEYDTSLACQLLERTPLETCTKFLHILILPLSQSHDSCRRVTFRRVTWTWPKYTSCTYSFDAEINTSKHSNDKTLPQIKGLQPHSENNYLNFHTYNFHGVVCGEIPKLRVANVILATLCGTSRTTSPIPDHVLLLAR
jgi:hypothetical protein